VIIKRVVGVFRAGGVLGVLKAVARRIRTPRARSFAACRELARGAIGLEIGGPSPIFAWGGLLPLYPVAGRIDNCNFARSTIWEGDIREGQPFDFHPGKTPGRQFIAEGADLYMVPSGDYSLVLSSHMLEHTANPLRALAEWHRVLEPGGALVLVVPHRDGTFDHRRPLTTMQHLEEDFARHTGEDDLTHLPEVLELHDVSRDPGVRDAEAFRDRARRNPEVRSLHQHVFDTRLVVQALHRSGFDVEAIEPLLPYHIVVLARKPLAGATPQPPRGDLLRRALQSSPFPTDRQAS
jgi:SAM-dependent methyltransferase